MITRIDTIFIPTADIRKAVTWYSKQFDFTVGWMSDDQKYCALQTGDTTVLTLFEVQDMQPSPHCILNFYSPTIKELYQKLMRQGVNVFDFNELPEIQFFEFLDCDDNRLGVCFFEE